LEERVNATQLLKEYQSDFDKTRLVPHVFVPPYLHAQTNWCTVNKVGR